MSIALFPSHFYPRPVTSFLSLPLDFILFVLFFPLRFLLAPLIFENSIHSSISILIAPSLVSITSLSLVFTVSLFLRSQRESLVMNWLSNILKSGTGRGGDGGGVRYPQILGEENKVLRAPSRYLDDRSSSQKEQEELDHATTLSLAEDSNRRNLYRWRADNGEELARTLHGSQNLHSYPSYSLVQYYPREYRICDGCKREIDYCNYMACMGTFFHPECFCCRACGHPITEHEFSLSGRDPYHKSCFKELTHPKCEVCHHFIPTNAAGLIEYGCHPFWSQKYCPSHEHDNTARCCSCERLESWNARHCCLEDGRRLCYECMESSIMDTGDCQPLYHAIRDYYEGINMKLDQHIPMFLVERQALNAAIVGEKHGFHHMPETRGLCLSEEQIVTSILKRPRVGSHRLIGIRTEPQKLTRKCEVTAILVLYGLPRLLTGAILAHELMHGWLRLRGYRNLNPGVEEGICQMLSYMWLESELMPGFKNMPSTSTASSSSSASKKGRKSDVENKLGEFFMHQIANDASPATGGGFRAANAAVNRYGLRRTLDHIRWIGNFPW